MFKNNTEGLTWVKTPKQSKCCLGCGATFTEGVTVLGNVKWKGDDVFALLNFCSIDCLTLNHPVLGYC